MTIEEYNSRKVKNMCQIVLFIFLFIVTYVSGEALIKNVSLLCYLFLISLTASGVIVHSLKLLDVMHARAKYNKENKLKSEEKNI